MASHVYAWVQNNAGRETYGRKLAGTGGMRGRQGGR